MTFGLLVTPDNTDVDFAIAGVIDFETDVHTDGEQPFLQVRVFAPGMLNNFQDIFIRIFTAGPNGDMTFFGNSTFDPETGEFWFLPWTCLNVDLSDFVGTQVFFEFIASGCSIEDGVHRGYMYLNGICKDNSAPLSAELNVSEVICTNTDFQVIPTNISGEIINHTWKIEQISPASTEEFESAIIPGQPVTFSNILARLNTAFQRPIPCGAILRITLSMNGICDEIFSVSNLVTVVCPTREVVYCDLSVCTDFQSVQMQGTNTCTDCTIQWNGAGYLNDDHLAYPTVLTNLSGWSDHVYSVQVIEPNGCIHNDEIKIVLTSLTSGELSLNEVCIDNCAFALQVVYEANSAIVPTNFTIQIFDNTNTLFFEPESFTLETLPNGRIRHLFEISGPILADLEESTFTVQMHPKVHEGYCEIGNCDLFLDAEIIIPKNRFLKVPNVYIPNGSNTTNQLFSPFFSHDSPEGGVYWVEMSIWDSNGSLIYLNELQALPSCTSLYGYEGDETGFPWNGHVNNNTGNNCGPFNNDSCLCAIGVYTYKIKYRNCLQQWQVEGTVTLIY